MTLKINHFIGGILLVAGTTIGAGMLALPVMTAFAGFYPSLLLFFLLWLFMLATAFFFLDVNLSVRGETNLISMAGRTLGTWGKAISWFFYLLLLYSLTAAYIAGSTPLFVSAIHYLTGYELPHWLAPFSLPVLFGSFVYLGTLGVDLVNRFLMLGLILAYAFLIAFVPAHVQFSFLSHMDFPAMLIAIPVVLTSFGYHIIIPTLTTYMQHDKKHLRWTLLIGSAIPFAVYFLWEFLSLGVIPFDQMLGAWKAGVSATVPLANVLQNPWISSAAQFFSFFAIITSFLGVSLSLSDFLTDGLKIKKSWEGRLIACALTFLPPLVFVFTCDRGFYLALQYAGVFVAILLGFLPAAMAWTLRGASCYRTRWGRALLLTVMALSLALALLCLFIEQGAFQHLISPYL